jgi:hypothetical protein
VYAVRSWLALVDFSRAAGVWSFFRRERVAEQNERHGRKMDLTSWHIRLSISNEIDWG